MRFGPGGSETPAKAPTPETPGEKLRRARERLELRMRDVEQASQKIAEKYGQDEFIVLINRLSEIENRGLVPGIYKLYSLAAIYRLDYEDLLEWYKVPVSSAAADSLLIECTRTHEVGFRAEDHYEATVPIALDPGIDTRKTNYLSRMIQKWGRLPLMFLDGQNMKAHRYAFVGSEDWFMYPLIPPGSFLIIDETRRRVASSGWTNEFDRPIYLLEHRLGHACAWCNLSGNTMILQPHPSSGCEPQIYAHPSDIEVVGQVTGVAKRLDSARRRQVRSSIAE
jgi:transcriptional regulator with XRE-family HTH domain